MVSDVDGTITRSDVLGHLAPLVGKDWSHAGVAQLYNNIKVGRCKSKPMFNAPGLSAN